MPVHTILLLTFPPRTNIIPMYLENSKFMFVFRTFILILLIGCQTIKFKTK